MYPSTMKNISRAIGRYAGTDLSPSSDSSIKEIRRKGRIAIMDETRNSIAELMAIDFDDPKGPRRVNARFPLTLVLPRAVNRWGKFVQADPGSDITVDVVFNDYSSLEKAIAHDRRELKFFIKRAVEREILQAVLFRKIEIFRAAFSDHVILEIEKRLGDSVESGPTPAAPSTAALDEAKKLKLIREADRLLNGQSGRELELRPTQRSLEFINSMIGSGTGANVAQVRYWEMEIRRYSNFISGWVKWFNKKTTELRQPGLLLQSVQALGISFLGAMLAVQLRMNRIHDKLTLDESLIRQKEFIEQATALRDAVGVKANQFKPFYLKLAEYGQDRYPDEAVEITFEYLLALREEPKVYPELDPEIPQSRYAAINAAAQKFTTEVLIQKNGLVNEKGDVVVPATQERLPLRDYNLHLAELLAERESQKYEAQFGGDLEKRLKNPLPAAKKYPREEPISLPPFKPEKAN